MKALTPKYLDPFIYSLIISTILVVPGILFPNEGECPDYYTQEMINQSRCTVGAVIGPSASQVYTLAAGVMTLGISMSYYRYKATKVQKATKKQAVVKHIKTRKK